MPNLIPIKIGIDGRELALSPSGIGRYVAELCKVLDVLLPSALFFVYSNHRVDMPLDSRRWIAKVDPLVGADRLHPLAWFLLRAGTLSVRDRIDVFWGATTILPRLPKSIRTVVTVYDLFHMDRNLVSLRRWVGHGLLYRGSLARANAISAISDATSRKVRSVFNCDVDAIIRPGVSEVFRPLPRKEIDKCLRSMGIRAPYILAVASRHEPRKNLAALLAAFEGLKDQLVLPNHSLLLVGRGGSRAFAEYQLARRIDSNSIRAIAQISDEELAALYGGCDAFVMPSTHEGFGIPVLEARACGAKIVASDIAELHEAGGEDALYIEPTTEGIQRGILEALSQQKVEHPKTFYSITWKDSGIALAQLLLAQSVLAKGDGFRQ